MPDGGGGGGQQQWSNSSSMGQTGPSPVIAPRLESVGDAFWDWFGTHANPAPSQRSTSANEWLWNVGNAGLRSPERAAGRSQVLDTLSGKYLNPDENPAFQDFLAASFRPQAEQFRDIIAPSIDAKFAGSGRTASGAHFNTTMRGVQDLERAQADAAAKAGLGLYQGERGNQFAALSALPQFQAMDYGDVNALAQSGAFQDYQNYGAQADWYSRMAQIIQGIYPGGQTNQSGYSSGAGGRTGGSGVMGGILGGAGLALQALPLFGVSDANAKDIKGRVGETDEGLPLYLYTYKGDDEPRIGPVAQEVAEFHPEAVARHPSGYLMVDYSKATPPGGLL